MFSQKISRPIGIWITSAYLFMESMILLFFSVFIYLYRDSLTGVFLEQFTRDIVMLPPQLYVIIGVTSFIFAIIFGVIAYGIFQMQKWGQISATVFLFLGLFYFPEGTILSMILLLFLWAHKDTRESFH